MSSKNEVNPLEFGLEPVKAKEMVSGLDVVIAERDALKESYKDIISLEITEENIPIFKDLRLKIVKNRTQGIEKWHKTNKAFYLAGGRFVDAIKNKEILENEQMESKLLEAEKYFENLEKEAKAKLNAERLQRIADYVEDTTGLDFSDMSDSDFEDYILGKKTRFEKESMEREAAALEAERELLAETERQKAIQLENDKLKAELKAKQLAEAEELGRRNAEIIAKQKEAEQLLKAGVNEQLKQWVDSFSIEIPTHLRDNELANEILSKFWGFKSWSNSKIK
jgi:hypothetical protein